MLKTEHRPKPFEFLFQICSLKMDTSHRPAKLAQEFVGSRPNPHGNTLEFLSCPLLYQTEQHASTLVYADGTIEAQREVYPDC